MIVIFTDAWLDPPLLFANTVYVTGEICSVVGTPQIVPLFAPNERPEGNEGCIAQDTIIPGPLRFAFSGKSGLLVLFVKVKF